MTLRVTRQQRKCAQRPWQCRRLLLHLRSAPRTEQHTIRRSTADGCCAALSSIAGAHVHRSAGPHVAAVARRVLGSDSSSGARCGTASGTRHARRHCCGGRRALRRARLGLVKGYAGGRLRLGKSGPLRRPRRWEWHARPRGRGTLRAPRRLLHRFDSGDLRAACRGCAGRCAGHSTGHGAGHGSLHAAGAASPHSVVCATTRVPRLAAATLRLLHPALELQRAQLLGAQPLVHSAQVEGAAPRQLHLRHLVSVLLL